MAVIEAAVGVYRSLAETNLAAYLPELAISLNNLSINLARCLPAGRGSPLK